ncbi:hypothetical protein KIW84_044749 [Lathyrus oleraceus]|uniref:Uncharacterized protein n=1 Tax=Pisum sativum TaxID=3888 RepID=A0A9D5AWB3_PEA|nr:hypothetical protein KIW84_044749 [Pisum sativum]
MGKLVSEPVKCEGNVEVNNEQAKVSEGNAGVSEGNVEVNNEYVEVNESNVEFNYEQTEANDDDYVESEYSEYNEDSEVNGASENSKDMNWTRVLPHETLGEASGIKRPTDMQHEECEDSDHLYTYFGSDDDEDVVKFPTYKSGEESGFHLGMMFINKEMVRDVIKEYGMEKQKNVFIKKNDAKRMVYDYFRKSTFEKTYPNIIFPTNGPQLWPIVDHVPVYPHVMRRAIGRPKKPRKKTNDDPKNPCVLSRRLSTVTCKRCGEMSHNKRSCKDKRVVERAMPKGGNKAKTNKGGKGKKKASKNQDEIGQGSQAPQAT